MASNPVMSLRSGWPAFALILTLGTAGALARDAGEVLPSVRAKVDHPNMERAQGIPSDEALEASGARIGRIVIVRDNVFDTSKPQEDASIPRLANRLHIRTKPDTVSAQLLFASGSAYCARDLAESERLLRKTRYLQDATIRPIAWHDGLVDVEVRTHDVWTLNPGLSFGRSGGESSTGLSIEELNLLGYGAQLSFGIDSSVDRDSKTLTFQDDQLLDSWWRFGAQVAENSDGHGYGLNLERPFFAMDTRWATGISARDEQRIDSLYERGKVVERFQARETRSEVYGGWSSGLRNGWTKRWRGGFTYDDTRFEHVSGESPTTVLPQPRKLVYPWIDYEWAQDRFAKARNRDQIERTEDINLGWRFGARLGYAATTLGADRNAPIFSARLDKGFASSDTQTMLLSSSVAGRWEGGSFADTLASVSGRYYLRQSKHRLLYLGMQTDLASNLDADHQLLLGGDSGLRGYPLRYQGGEGRWLFTAEQRWFSNWYPFRLFNVGGAAFFDAGRTWGANPVGGRSLGLLKDIGVGLRLGNSRSALGNVLHIDVAMPLDATGSIDKVQFLIHTLETF